MIRNNSLCAPGEGVARRQEPIHVFAHATSSNHVQIRAVFVEPGGAPPRSPRTPPPNHPELPR
jgi:hypothetical protein